MLRSRNDTKKHLKFEVIPNKVSQEDLGIISTQIENAVWRIYTDLLGRGLNKNVSSLEINAEIYIKSKDDNFIFGRVKNGTITSD